MAAFRTYSPFLEPVSGTTGTGLDQVIRWLGTDPGLLGAGEAARLGDGIAAADALNNLLITGLKEIGSFDDPVLDEDDIRRLNAWILQDTKRTELFRLRHGNTDDVSSSGFHQLLGQGATSRFRDQPLVDTVLEGLYQFGFPITAEGRFLNEDGEAAASVTQVAAWLTALRRDPATTGSGLDRLTEAIVADAGLAFWNPWSGIAGGAGAADGLNHLILEGLAAMGSGGGADGDPTRISAAEVRWLHGWMQANPDRLDRFRSLHGDDSFTLLGGFKETGFHQVQGNGASTLMFANSLVDTVMDGLYHIGFSLTPEGVFLNEDGTPNASDQQLADWLTYFLGDASTTGTGLDRIVDLIKSDRGLATFTAASAINQGAAAADGLNQLIVQAIGATGVQNDGWISRSDLRRLNRWISTNAADTFLALHGDDEDGVSTGFHLVQGNGAQATFLGQNLVDTVSDGIYHLGFTIVGQNFVNEDGNINASLSDVSSWLNYFLGSRRVSYGTLDADIFIGNGEGEQVLGYAGNDQLEGAGGNDLLDGGFGDDSLSGGEGEDTLDGGYDNDRLDGGEGSDVYLVSGRDPSNPDWQNYSFEGYDTYADAGSVGSDVILATGSDGVDIGFHEFLPSSGIEVIDASGAGGPVRLLAHFHPTTLDFSATTLIGSAFEIVGSDWDDTLVGSARDERISAGSGNDRVSGGGGNDILRGGMGQDWLDGGEDSDDYEVSGLQADWLTFQAFDTYADTGSKGVDRIVAVGAADVDIGITGFGAASGIEQVVNSTAATVNGVTTVRKVRLLAGWGSDSLDFSRTLFIGGNISIDASLGNDIVIGTAGGDAINGGSGDDILTGGENGSGTVGDILTGGSGFDRFVFRSVAEVGLGSAGRDAITDFRRGVDRIDFGPIDANATTPTANEAFTLRTGVSSFSGRAGELIFLAATGTTPGLLRGDVNGDRQADFELALPGVTAIATTDFVSL